ncbi:MAG: HPr family phosphocarrier protein [Lachnospiraceae bacterium]|nr:HPr family phosphocarrier protein [Lachnospiraceae bacterium]
MKTFDYTITDELGIHARPAGELVKEAKKYSSAIFINANGRKVNAAKLMMIMGLGVKKGTVVTIEADGEDEDAAIAGLRTFFSENL